MPHAPGDRTLDIAAFLDTMGRDFVTEFAMQHGRLSQVFRARGKHGAALKTTALTLSTSAALLYSGSLEIGSMRAPDAVNITLSAQDLHSAQRGGAYVAVTAPAVEHPLLPTQPGQAEFDRLLATGDYQAAIDLYDGIYVNSTESRSAEYRSMILEHASRLIQNGSPAGASDLLNRYVSIYYTDVEALIVLGRSYRDQQRKFDAIKAFQQAFQSEHRLAVRELIINQENNIIGELVQELRERNQLASVTDLYENLTQLQPDVPGYFIGLANAYAAQNRFIEAIQALRYVQGDVDQGPRARALIDTYSALQARS